MLRKQSFAVCFVAFVCASVEREITLPAGHFILPPASVFVSACLFKIFRAQCPVRAGSMSTCVTIVGQPNKLKDHMCLYVFVRLFKVRFRLDQQKD